MGHWGARMASEEGEPTRIHRTYSPPARRRRTGYVAATLVAAVTYVLVASLAVVAASGTFVQPPAVAAERQGASRAEDDATIVAAWSRLSVGWIYVYGDGRVVLRHDSGRLISSKGDVYYGIIERHLSPVGVQLVRSGAVDFEDILDERDALQPGFWSPIGQALYRSSSYALCLLNTAPNPPPDELLLDVPDIVDRLSGAARAVLRDGVARSFTDEFLDDRGDFVGMDGFHSAPGRGVECLVIDLEGMLRLWALTRLPSFSGSEDRGVLRLSDATFGLLTSADGDEEFLMAAIPILPHGGWVLWAG